MSRSLAGVLAALLAIAGGSTSRAMTSDGTMITAVACITHSSPSGLPFTVSFCVTGSVIVLSPCLTGQKIATPTAQVSGGSVTFKIWAVNCSCTNSAFNINITDRLPDNTIMGSNIIAWNGNSGGVWYPASGSNNTTWAPNPPPQGQAPPYFLRYVLDQLGPCHSAFVQFTVTLQ